MNQQADHAAEQATLYLQQMGLRPSTKGYQYLNFALVQLLQGTPFQNTIWELTAIHFGQTRKNVMACVRREIAHAFGMGPPASIDRNRFEELLFSPKVDEFLHLSLMTISDYE